MNQTGLASEYEIALSCLCVMGLPELSQDSMQQFCLLSGASLPLTGSVMVLLTCVLLLLFFSSARLSGLSVVNFCEEKKNRIGLKFSTTIHVLMDILQVDVKIILVWLFSLSYLSKIIKKKKKKHSVSHNIVKKSPIGLTFCRNTPMGSLQGQLK